MEIKLDLTHSRVRRRQDRAAGRALAKNRRFLLWTA